MGRFDLDQQESLLVALVNHFHAIDLPYALDHKDCKTAVFVYHDAHRIEAYAFIHRYEDLQRASVVSSSRFQCICAKLYEILKSDPVCVLCLLFTTLCFWMFLRQDWLFLSSLTFQDLPTDQVNAKVSGFDAIINIFYDGQFWRLLTPSFLHFNWVEFLFGVVTFTYLGWQIERQEGTVFFVFALCFLSLMANLCQFYLSPNMIFGGATGVTFGLFVYMLLDNRYHVTPVYRFSPWFTLFVFLVVVGNALVLNKSFSQYFSCLGPMFFGFFLVFIRRHLLHHFYEINIKFW